MEIVFQELERIAREKPKPMPEQEFPDGFEGEEGFVEGLGAAELEALTGDSDEGSSVIKMSNPTEEAEAIIQEARAKADEIVATAEQLGLEYKNNSRREADIECNRIKADARQEGYQEGLQQAEAEYSDRMRELELKSIQLEEEYSRLIDELEPRFVNTITSVYEHIFTVDLAQYEPLVAQLIARTMRRVESSQTYIVHVSSEDYPSISSSQREMLNDSAPGCNVEIVEDIGLGRYQCLLETDNGVFDCGLDTHLSELSRKLRLLSYNPGTEGIE